MTAEDQKGVVMPSEVVRVKSPQGVYMALPAGLTELEHRLFFFNSVLGSLRFDVTMAFIYLERGDAQAVRAQFGSARENLNSLLEYWDEVLNCFAEESADAG